MPLFAKVETKDLDFPGLEEGILHFWETNQIFEKSKAKNANSTKQWSFLDGPITANNPMGVHHAWGRTYKDLYNRYFAMTGHQLRYQQGFDCQGLWVEVEVEKALGLKSKRDIENLVEGDVEASIAKFVQLCKDRVNQFARVQTEQSIRLGYWMDWDRTNEDWAKPVDERKSYFTMSEANNVTIWSFLKKCHHKGLVYKGFDVMPWCGRCGVGISEMEMKEGYKTIEHRSAFVKLPLKNRPGENLLVWTTTPWTLTSNVGAAVNPKLTYLQVKLKDEIYYVSKGAFKLNRMESGEGEEEGDNSPKAGGKKSKREWIDGVPHLKSIEQIFKEKAGKEGFTIVGELLGEALLGWEYVGPFDDLPAQNTGYGFPEEVARIVKLQGWNNGVTGAAAHRVVSGGDNVTESEGTGIVHTAPGCGQIDFVWGKENQLPPIAPIGEDGKFLDGFGSLTGLSASDKSTADAVFELLKTSDRLFATERYVHRYPHCWRCKTELLYRLVDEWFINMGPRNTTQGFRGDVMKVVDQVNFLPESLNGQARERDWLWNMGDWMISKKRFWGLALPIWVDEETGDFEVIGSREELQERAVEGLEAIEGQSLHRPYLDRVKIRNPKNGNLMTRIPDVGNPWLDAGIVAFSTMKYNTDRAYWEKWYPADFIVESFPGQFRNWFYALLTMSTMMSDGKPPFRNLLGHGTVFDQLGKPMHKADGNSIPFEIAASEMGADVCRWMYARTNPAANLNFGPKPADEIRAKFHIKFWNCYAFFTNNARADGFNPLLSSIPVSERPDIDRWILSELQTLIQTANEAIPTYDVAKFCLACEKFLDDSLSNWYVRRSRRRFAKEGFDRDCAYQTLYTVLVTLCKLCAPVIPFFTETIYQNLRNQSDPESIHLTDYPVADTALMDDELSKAVEVTQSIVTAGGAARNVAKVKNRQPLAEMIVKPSSPEVQKAIERFDAEIREELNIKKISFTTENLLNAEFKLLMKTAGAKIGPKGKDVQAELAKRTALELKAELRKGDVDIAGVMLSESDFAFTMTAPEGLAGAEDKSAQVVLDTRITPELAQEGMAREVIRHVNELRKLSELNIEDRIALTLLTTSPGLSAALWNFKDYIAEETLTKQWGHHAHSNSLEVEVDGQPLRIELHKMD